jgi:D-serine deaminase-like pyridoxal phosphate-dependent protein
MYSTGNRPEAQAPQQRERISPEVAAIVLARLASGDSSLHGIYRYLARLSQENPVFAQSETEMQPHTATSQQQAKVTPTTAAGLHDMAQFEAQMSPETEQLAGQLAMNDSEVQSGEGAGSAYTDDDTASRIADARELVMASLANQGDER